MTWASQKPQPQRLALRRDIRRMVLKEGLGVDDARVKAQTSALMVWGALRELRPDTDPWVRLAHRRATEEAARSRK
ncbi:MAG: hypothetical protein KA267_12350 [Gemmatimonadales bacterium]|nr:hypothetical protein [Gemmatimonadales bacterium]